MACGEVWLRGRQSEPGNEGDEVNKARWASDPDFTSCPASLHSQIRAGAGH